MWLIGLFLAFGVVLGPLGAQAPPSGRVWRIGLLETSPSRCCYGPIR